MIRFTRHMAVRVWITALLGTEISLLLLTLFPLAPGGGGSLAIASLCYGMVFFATGWLAARIATGTLYSLTQEAELYEFKGEIEAAQGCLSRLSTFLESYLVSPRVHRRWRVEVHRCVAMFCTRHPERGPGREAIERYLTGSTRDPRLARLWLNHLAKDDDNGAAPAQPSAQSSSTLSSGESDRIKRWSWDGGTSPTMDEDATEYQEEGPYGTLPVPTSGEGSVRRWPKLSVDGIVRALRVTAAAAAGQLRTIGPFIRARQQAVVLTLLLFLSASLFVLIVNTLDHLSPGKSAAPDSTTDSDRTVSRVPAGRFTIQVAAYLKQTHARDYVRELRGKGLEAYMRKAAGTRRVWFQVRVARFGDKTDARRYGSRLKSSGIIEDFYVANYHVRQPEIAP